MPMVSQAFVSSIIVNGDVDLIFETLLSMLTKMDFTVKSKDFPLAAELTRGKGGLINTKIQKCKTVLNVSIKEAASAKELHILFDYQFEIHGLFTDGDKEHIQGEVSKIHHHLFDIAPSRVPKFYKEFQKKQKNKK